MCFSVYFEDFDSLVGRTGCKSAAIIVKDSIVLGSQEMSALFIQIQKLCAYDHIFMARIGDDLGLRRGVSRISLIAGLGWNVYHDADHMRYTRTVDSFKVSPSPLSLFCVRGM